MPQKSVFVITISADAEWKVTRKCFQGHKLENSPFGEWFTTGKGESSNSDLAVIFIHGGWGKVAAAASTQYAISRWDPKLLVNLGTCGGFEGDIAIGEIILVDKTIIYDIYEQMGDPDEHLRHYMTDIDASWIENPVPMRVVKTKLVSGDRDLFCDEIPLLKSRFDAVAGDWESGAIAWVAAKNHTPCLILRGVTDLVGESGGEAYQGNVNTYYKNTELVMKQLIDKLPEWLSMYERHLSSKT